MIVLEPQALLNKACVGYYAKEEGPCLIYDYDKLVDCFVEDGMTVDEAVEWVDYNVLGAWFDTLGPVVVTVVSGGSE